MHSNITKKMFNCTILSIKLILSADNESVNAFSGIIQENQIHLASTFLDYPQTIGTSGSQDSVCNNIDHNASLDIINQEECASNESTDETTKSCQKANENLRSSFQSNFSENTSLSAIYTIPVSNEPIEMSISNNDQQNEEINLHSKSAKISKNSESKSALRHEDETNNTINVLSDSAAENETPKKKYHFWQIKNKKDSITIKKEKKPIELTEKHCIACCFLTCIGICGGCAACIMA